MKDDQEHRQLCYALRQTVDRNGECLSAIHKFINHTNCQFWMGRMQVTRCSTSAATSVTNSSVPSGSCAFARWRRRWIVSSAQRRESCSYFHWSAPTQSAGSIALNVYPCAVDVARWLSARISRSTEARSTPSGVEPIRFSRPSSCFRKSSAAWSHHCPVRFLESCPWLAPTPSRWWRS